MIAALESGFFRREIAEASFAYQREVEAGRKLIVGVNAFQEPDDAPIELLRIDDAVEREQVASLQRVKEKRSHDDRAPGPGRRPARGLEFAEPDAALARGGRRPRDGRRDDERAGRCLRSLRWRSQMVSSCRSEGPMSLQHRPMRIVLAKVGLDGHDRGIKVVARALRDAGFHVIYAGLWQTPEAVVRAVADEDADWLGLSLLSGAHMTLVPRVLEQLGQAGLGDVGVIVGGTIPAEDVPKLLERGVAHVFGPGTPLVEVVEFLRGRGGRSDA